MMRRVLVALLPVPLLGLPATAAPIFTGLGDLPGGVFESQAFAVSDDGSTVVGWSRSAHASGSPRKEAFRWTEGEGIVGLGIEGGSDSEARGVSADGSVIVGSGGPGGGAFRWTRDGGMVALGDGVATAVAADGSVIAGWLRRPATWPACGYDVASAAVRWISGGVECLGRLPDPARDPAGTSDATAVSADGSVVVGSGVSGSGQEAFRWTRITGMLGLGDLQGGTFRSRATAVSADGSVVVGAGSSARSDPEGFRWTSSGMVGLGNLPGAASGEALGVSPDGLVIVGQAHGAFRNEAFIWDAANGMRALKDVLVDDYGLDLTGWSLTGARGVAVDGHPCPTTVSVVGWGTNPLGFTEGWIARFPVDVDDDGVGDLCDNCTEIPNPNQEDVDAGADDDMLRPGIQHYGDACDADLNNDGLVGAIDFFGVFRPCIGVDPRAFPDCARADLDGDGVIGASDFFGRLRPAMGTAPGPGVTETP